MSKMGKHMRWWIIPLAIMLLVNIIASFIHGGIDLTEENRFTISASTRQMIAGLKDPMTLTIYLKGDIPAGFKRLGNAANDMAETFRSISSGKIDVRFEHPGEGLSDTSRALLYDSLQRMGINPTNVKAQQKESERSEETLVFPGAILSGINGQVGIDFLEGQSNLNGLESLNNAEALMEYKLAKAILSLTREKIPVVGYLIGNGQPLDLSVYDLVEKVIRKDYGFSLVPIDSVKSIPIDFDALMIVRPLSSFSTQQKLKIDQYIMNGGKVLWAMDNLYANMDSLQRSSGSFVAFDLGLGLDDMLFKYGVRINRDLLQDLECDKVPSVIGNVGEKPQIELLPWPYAPLLRNPSGHPISRNLDHVLSSFPQTMDTVQAPGISKHMLLTSSGFSRTLQTPALVEWRSIRTESDLKKFDRSSLPTAILLEGKFRSPFTNRVTASDLASLELPFKEINEKDNSMIVLSDADIVLNAVSQQDGPLPMGMNNYTRQQFANKDFISNCLFYLTGGQSIVEARGKTYRLRLLNMEELDQRKSFWRLFTLLLPLVFPVMLFFIYGFLRKHKYARIAA
jgi:ABC-2 type transport system permease protein